MRFLVAEKLGPHKFKTPEGYLICTDAILSRTGKQEYKRCELFGDTCEDPDKIVNVERTDDEVFSDKAMASFENKAVCIEHPDHDVNAENHNELAVGFVRDIHKGEDNGKPVMMGTLVITDKDAVEAVESGEYKELSCGYDCDIDDDGEPCQRNIRGNHVALCKQGRAGIARIVDSVDDAGIKVWQVRQGYAIVVKRYWKQYGRNAFVDATESSIEAARYHRGSLERNDKMEFVIVDCNDGKYKIEDEGMKDIQATKTPGTDKIIYVMQSDIDKNLYFYIGKTFSMKEGAWGYTKFEMGNDTPEKIKAELARNGWHQVASGPARVIDTSDLMLSGRYVYFDFAEVKGKSLKQEIERKYNSKFNEKIKVKRLDKHWVPGKKEVEIQVFADGMHENYDGFWAVVQATEEESKQLKDDWTVVEEENYEKANKPVGAKDEKYVQLPRGRFMVVTKTKEELEKEGYGYHHSDRGYSVYVKNNQAVAIKDSVKEKLFTIEFEKDGITHIHKVRANSIEDAISKVKSQDAGALPSSTWQHGSVYVNASSQITSQKIVSDIRDFMRSAGFAVCKIENGKVDELTISLKVSVVPSGKKGNAASFTFDLTYIPTSSYEHKYKSSSVSETQITTQLRKFANSKLYEDKSLE
ncbi:DUF2213 domain-containing protein [Ruminococcus sp.]|uniref:DUF2213 domain-containing protein n=1 Tax=Ruminococcus sp. TaxID=41978 RepID=UPI003AF01285